MWLGSCTLTRGSGLNGSHVLNSKSLPLWTVDHCRWVPSGSFYHGITAQAGASMQADLSQLSGWSKNKTPLKTSGAGKPGISCRLCVAIKTHIRFELVRISFTLKIKPPGTRKLILASNPCGWCSPTSREVPLIFSCVSKSSP